MCLTFKTNKMNCQLCQQYLETYQKGKLPNGIGIQVKEHLLVCNSCAIVYQTENITNKVIDEEKAVPMNPFLVTRIMAGINSIEQKQSTEQYVPVHSRVLKPVLLGISVAAAILLGIFAGSIYQPIQANNTMPQELVYMNDAALESVNLFSDN